MTTELGPRSECPKCGSPELEVQRKIEQHGTVTVLWHCRTCGSSGSYTTTAPR